MVNNMLERMGRDLDLSAESPHPIVINELARLASSTSRSQRDLCNHISDRIKMEPAISHSPELAFCLYVLRQSVVHPHIAQGYFKLLAFHAGLMNLEQITSAPVLVLRQFKFGNYWHRRDRTDTPFILVDSGPNSGLALKKNCTIIKVRSEQFSDMALDQVWDAGRGSMTSDISVIEKALDLLHEKLNPPIAKLFGDIVHYLLISTEISNGKRHSFNLRLAYPGAIFLDPARRPALLVAEDILHEWIHQILWLAWELKHRAFSSAEWNCSVISPLTGNRRALPVLSQALVIYHAAAHFLRLHQDGPAWCGFAAKRLADLENKLPVLLTLIRNARSTHPAIQEAIAHVENTDAACN